MSLILKGDPTAPCTQRVLLTAAELGVELQMVNIDIWNGEQKKPDYIANEHPFGRIPVLHDGDYKIFESRAIARYIALKKSEDSPLYPKDIQLRGLIEQWISAEQSYYEAVEEINVQLLWTTPKGGTPNLKKVEKLAKEVRSFFEVFEKHLKGRNYLVGNQFTLADIVFIPNTNYFLQTEEFKNILKDYPNVERWWNSVSSRPSWKKVAATSH